MNAQDQIATLFWEGDNERDVQWHIDGVRICYPECALRFFSVSVVDLVFSTQIYLAKKWWNSKMAIALTLKNQLQHHSNHCNWLPHGLILGNSSLSIDWFNSFVLNSVRYNRFAKEKKIIWEMDADAAKRPV